MDYETKDSGTRQYYDSGMKRDSQDGKPRFDLMIPIGQKYTDTLLYRFAMLLGRGAGKYGDRDWEQANSKEELERFKQSAIRHMMQWMSDDTDEDHAAAVLFNLMAAEYVKDKTETFI